MLVLALICTVGGLVLVGWAILRGEWTERLPSYPERHWRLGLGALVLLGGSLILVVTLAVPRLAQEPVTLTQPVVSSGLVEPVSTLPNWSH
jgi:hypothetical protein